MYWLPHLKISPPTQGGYIKFPAKT
jgi:hypothetical protein